MENGSQNPINNGRFFEKNPVMYEKDLYNYTGRNGYYCLVISEGMFYMYSGSLKKWNPMYVSAELTEEQLAKIIEELNISFDFSTLTAEQIATLKTKLSISSFTAMKYYKNIYYNSTEKPDKPVCTNLSNLVSGWFSDTTGMEGKIWYSNAIVDDNGNVYGEWLDPSPFSLDIDIKTIGLNNIPIYKQSKLRPSTPIFTNIDILGSGWASSYDETLTYEEPLWVSFALVDISNNVSNSWSVPARITGIDGKPGLDGKDIEFIFKRTLIEGATNRPDTPIGTDVDEWTDEANGWYDRPQGITETYRCEWESIRYKTNGIWGAFCTPFPQSVWGIRGLDGDGFEYIFTTRAKYDSEGNILEPTIIIPSDENKQIDNYLPKDEEGNRWKDDFFSMTVDKPVEWMASRKRTSGVWSDFSDVHIFNRLPEDIDVDTRYYLTNTEGKPALPLINDDGKEVDVNGDVLTSPLWSLFPKGVDKDHLFEYYTIRWKKKNIWGDFSPVSLWSTYSGAISAILDLSNELTGVNCTDEGAITGEIPITVAHFYVNGEQDPAGCVFSIIPEGTGYTVGCTASIKNNVVTIDKSSVNDSISDFQVGIQCTYKNVDYIKTFRVMKNYPGVGGGDAVSYFILLSDNAVKKNDTVYSPSTIICTAYKKIGDNNPIVATNVSIRYIKDGGAAFSTISSGDSISLSSLKPINYVSFELIVDGSTSVWDKETLPILENGKDSVIYELKPSVTTIKKVANTYTPSAISCTVNKTIANATSVVSLPIKYSIDGGTEMTYSGDINLSSSIVNYISFFLYVNNVKVDIKNVTIVADGIDGKDKEYIACLYTAGTLPTNRYPANPIDRTIDDVVPIYPDDYNGVTVPEGERWTDDANDVTKELPYLFLSERTKEYNSTTKRSEWGAFSKPKVRGHYGDNGDNGDDARVVNLIASDLSVEYDTSGNNPQPNSIVITANALNTIGTVYYEFLKNGISIVNSTSKTYNYVSNGLFKDMPEQIEVRVREGSLASTILATDQISIIGIKAGSDSIVAYLTNDSHVLPASSEGVVSDYSNSGTSVRVYQGITELVYDGIGASNGKWKVTAVGTNISAGTKVKDNSFCTINNANTMSNSSKIAYISYTIEGKNLEGLSFSIVKIQSFSKATGGTIGTNGTPGAIPKMRTIEDVVGQSVTYKSFYDSSNSYYDVILAIVDNTNKMFVKKGTNKVLTINTVNDLSSTEWEEGVTLNMIASKLVVTDAMYTQILTAINAKIDDLVVKKLQTTPTEVNGLTIKIEGGLIVCRNGNTHNNLTIGIADDGYVGLNYYDENNVRLWGCDRNGYFKAEEIIETWIPIDLYEVPTSLVGYWIPYTIFSDIYVGNTYQYTARGTGLSDEQLAAVDRIFVGKDITSILPPAYYIKVGTYRYNRTQGGSLPDGWYMMNPTDQEAQNMLGSTRADILAKATECNDYFTETVPQGANHFTEKENDRIHTLQDEVLSSCFFNYESYQVFQGLGGNILGLTTTYFFDLDSFHPITTVGVAADSPRSVEDHTYYPY